MTFKPNNTYKQINYILVKPGWKIGNIMNGNLTEMLNSPLQKEFGRLKSSLPDRCKDCQWLTYCRGGCPRNRGISAPAFNLNYFCRSYQMFFEYADTYLEKLAERWRQQQVTVEYLQ